MLFGKYIDKILLSFCIPGIVLISRKKISGYFLYILFIIIFASPLFTNILLSFWSTAFFVVSILILFSISIILTLFTMHLPENPKFRNILSLIAILAYALLCTAIISATQHRIEARNIAFNAKAKIAYLDTLIADSTINQKEPDFLINHIKNIPIKPNFAEMTKWGPGIYIFVSDDTIFSAYKDPYQYYFNYSHLDSLLAEKKDSLLNLPVYFSFSKAAYPSKTMPVLLRLKSAGISNIKTCYIKDTNNIETHACNPDRIKKVKRTQMELVAQGKSFADAVAIAVMPILRSSPPFMVAIDTFLTQPSDQRFYGMVSVLKTLSNSYGCNIADMIDFCLLLNARFKTFSISEFNLDNLITGKENLL